MEIEPEIGLIKSYMKRHCMKKKELLLEQHTQDEHTAFRPIGMVHWQNQQLLNAVNGWHTPLCTNLHL